MKNAATTSVPLADLDVNEKLLRLISSPFKNTKEERERISNEMIELLRQGADIYMCNMSMHLTAFMFAAEYCSKEVIDTFMELAPSRWDKELLFTKRGRKGMTAAFFALKNNDPNVVKFFLDKIERADEVANSAENTLLMYAVSVGNVAAIAQLIDQCGANINAKIFGETALIRAVQSNNLAVVEMLLKKGADVNIGSHYDLQFDDFAVLLHAAENREIDIRIVEKLLTYDPTILFRNTEVGRESFHSAISSRNIPLVELFLNNGVFENMSEDEKATALHVAVSWNFPEAAGLLVNAGANPNRFVEHALFRGATILDNATSETVDRGEKKILKIFFTVGPEEQIKQAKEIALLQAVLTAGTELIKFILEHGVNVNIQDEEGNTPLHYLVNSEEHDEAVYEIAKLLLQHGANVEIANKRGRSALYYLTGNEMGKSEAGQKMISLFLASNENNADGNYTIPSTSVTNSQSSSSAIQVASQSGVSQKAVSP